MKILNLKDGRKAIVPPSYSEGFRQVMRFIGAQWQEIRTKQGPVKAWCFAPEHQAAAQTAYAEAYGEDVADSPAFPNALPSNPVSFLVDLVEIQVGTEIRFVFGGDFDKMVAAVKALDGRRWDAEAKRWIVSLRLSEEAVRAAVEQAGFRLLLLDEVQDAEIASIQGWQERVLAMQAQIGSRIADLDGQIARYVPGSKSRVRAELARERARLEGALDAASKPLEALVEVEVRSLRAVLREIR